MLFLLHLQASSAPSTKLQNGINCICTCPNMEVEMTKTVKSETKQENKFSTEPDKNANEFVPSWSSPEYEELVAQSNLKYPDAISSHNGVPYNGGNCCTDKCGPTINEIYKNVYCPSGLANCIPDVCETLHDVAPYDSGIPLHKNGNSL